MQHSEGNFSSVCQVLGELIIYRWKNARRPRKELDQIRRSLRVKALETFFLFHKGPHKFIDGFYPPPSDALFTKLLETVLSSLAKYKREVRAKSLKQLVDSLDKSRHSNLITFLLILSEFKADETASRTIQIPDKRKLLNTLSDGEVLTYSSFDTATFVLPVGGIGEQRTNRGQDSQCDFSGLCNLTTTEDNPFFDIHKLNRDNLHTNHFLGAFRSIGSEAKHTLCRTGLSTLRIPLLSSDSSKTTFSALDYFKSLNRSGDEDEGYSDICDRHSYPPPLTDETACQLVSSLLANTVPGVRDILLDHFYLFSRTSPDQTFMCPDQSNIEAEEMKRYCWTSRGLDQSSQELPFLTESGPWGSAVLLDVYKERYDFDLSHRMGNDEPGVFSDTVLPERLINAKTINHRRSFFYDLLVLRMGLQSSRFRWEVHTKMEQDGTEEPLEGQFSHSPNKMDAFSLGVSDLSLANTVKEHLWAGTSYRRLNWFAHKVVPLAPIPGKAWQGPTWACFIHAVAQWLLAYEEAIQLVLKEETEVLCRSQTTPFMSGLLELSHRLKTLTYRISFVADLCMLRGSFCPLLNSRGIELLVYLAVRADRFACTPAEPIARFLFKRACGPFLKFLERLLLDGIWDGSGDDFNLFVSNAHLLCRDAAFWSGAFKFVAVNPEDKNTHGFMNLLPVDFEQHVLRGAKSVHLLKLIAPKHFLFTNRKHFPRLCFPLNSIEVKEQQRALKNYLEKLYNSAVQLQVTRSQQWQKMVRMKQEELRQAMETHTRNIVAIEQKREHVQAAIRAKQGNEYATFKKAADQSEDRRIADAASERLAEKARAEVGGKVFIGEARLEADPIQTDSLSSVAKPVDISKPRANIDEKLEQFGPTAAGDIGRDTVPFSLEPTVTIPSKSEDIASLSKSNISIINNSHLDTDSDQCQKISTTTSNTSDRVQVKYHNRTAGFCEHSNTICPDHKRSIEERSVRSVTEPILPSSALGPTSSVRDRRGHPSESTIQNLLYGRGSGPACRPSKWELESQTRAANQARTESTLPDSIAFFQEALEPEDRSTAGAKAPAFTHEFPRFDQLTLVNPFESLRCSSATHRLADSVVELHVSQPDLDVIPLPVLLYKVVLAPITSYIHQLDEALCNHFLHSLKLLQHFHRLRKIFFLQDGEFSEALLTTLFEKANDLSSEQLETHSVQFLHDLMQSTARKFCPSSGLLDPEETIAPFDIDSHAPLIIDVPIDLVLNNQTFPATNRPAALDIPSLSLFDHLRIVYQPQWPLNILLNDHILSRYNLIFGQLVRVKYTAWILQSIYHQLRQSYTAIPQLDASIDLSRLHLSHLWLFEMQQVICGLESYLTNQAVKNSWTRFATSLVGDATTSTYSKRSSRIENLDQLASAHETYLQEVLRCCLADPADQELQQVLHGLLCCVHWFHKVLSSGQWIQRTLQLDHTGWKQLCAAHQSFRTHARFLRRRAGSLASAARFSSLRIILRQLILALGTNDFYAHVTTQSSDPTD